MSILSLIYSNIYQNFFTVCSLIPTVFLSIMGIIFLSVKNKSTATKILAFNYIFMSTFFLGFFIAALVYHPLGAYHRFLTVLSMFICFILWTNFFFYFPEKRSLGAAKVLTTVLAVIALIAFSYFVYYSHFKAGVYYNFSSHNYDFTYSPIEVFIPLLVFLFLITSCICGIWRFVVTKTKERWAILAITCFYFFGILIPSITNIMSKTGAVGRDIYQVSQDLSSLFVYFTLSIIYINSTKDKTTFMTKIIAITFATFLIVFQGVSYYGLKDQEKAYDLLKIKDTSLAVYNNYKPDDMIFLGEFYNGTNELEMVKMADDYSPIDINITKMMIQNVALVETIRSMPDIITSVGLKALFEKMDDYSLGYKSVLFQMFDNDQCDKNNLLMYIDNIQPEINKLYNAINNIANDDKFFQNAEKTLLKSKSKTIQPMISFLLDTMKKSKPNDSALKYNLMLSVLPMKNSSNHFFIAGLNNIHYISFIEVNLTNGTTYIAGYDYLKYRAFLHPSAKVLLLLLIGIIVVIVFGFRYFFLGAIINPLENLQKGIDEVQNGNLQVKVPVYIEDEIGLITRTFNNMVEKIFTSEKQLADYASNLEIKVTERTTELNASNIKLKDAMQALWGEMELAKKIQTALLPKNTQLPGYDVSAYMKPADEVGGDYYDIIQCDGKSWIVIGDVSGHGVPAGLIMMMAQTAIHTVIVQHPDLQPSALIKIINQVIRENIVNLNENKYMTLTVLAGVDDGKIVFSGLHQDILVYRKKDDTVQLVETNGIWIGVVDDISGMNQDEVIQLNSGDSLLLYTDGLTESSKDVNNLKVEYGTDKLVSAFNDCGKKSTSEIIKDIINTGESFKQLDDITMVVLKKL